MASGFGHMSVIQLKKELSIRGAKTSGRKAELVARLEAYERNDNFRTNDILGPAENPMPTWPDISEFRTVTEGHRDVLPNLKHSQIVQYVVFRQSQDKEENRVSLKFSFPKLPVICAVSKLRSEI